MCPVDEQTVRVCVCVFVRACVHVCFRIPISENPVIYGLLFAEMGNVWNTINMTESFDIPREGSFTLKRSAGIGFQSWRNFRCLQ